MSTILVVKYLYSKNYRFAFFFGLALCIVFVFDYALIYWMQMFRALVKFYIPVYSFVLFTAALYGLCLLFSKAAERPWLKAAGALTILLVILIGAGMITASRSLDFDVNIFLEKLMQVTTWLSILLPIFMILNLVNEVRHQKVISISKNLFTYLMSLITFSTSLLAIFLAQNLIKERLLSQESSGVNQQEYSTAQLFEERTFTDKRGNKIRYRFMKPVNYDPKKKYPIVVCLHHGGAHGSENIRQVEGSEAPWLANYENKRKYPAFLFVPQCPKGRSWLDPIIASTVFEAMAALELEFSIDVKRRYVMGISGGGYGSWHFASVHPEMFAAAVPICGAGNTGFASKLVNVGIWAFHGENDALAPVSGSRDMIAGIKKAGGKPRYSEFPGAGHDIWKNVHSTPGLLDWLFANRRE
ncbi:hypothetical protein L0657_12675 [Dyadobacter sp. CY345]|uniref:carboxylesterase family protein n=1 Tax=Dyadobacter sp. CY345 TaxID=2909335 RepID=UPI001F26A4B0|nr:hypothetical protein [Dyadobacter sp. CY345]MCF2444815.1 hypothetical protein [Dyadobacter sp. CY345]